MSTEQILGSQRGNNLLLVLSRNGVLYEKTLPHELRSCWSLPLPCYAGSTISPP